MKRILVTNDDGVRSEGLTALASALEPLGEVIVVAPAKEASAVGHALTLHYPLRLEQLEERVYAVDGTPTDCVNIAVAVVLKGLPDLVVSGINKGWNVGDDVTYSGTVSGALEGALLGVPSIAVSLKRSRDRMDFSDAARAAARVAERVLAEGLPPRTFLNINVPRRVTHGFRVTLQAKRTHVTSDQRTPRSKTPAVLLDRRGAGRVGGRRAVRLPGGPCRLHFDHAAASGPDRAPRDSGRRAAAADAGVHCPESQGAAAGGRREEELGEEEGSAVR